MNPIGRNGKPISLHIAEGNPKRLTKAEIQARKDNKIKLGKSDLDKLKPPSFVNNDVIAFAHWKQCMKDYKAAAEQNIELLTISDVGLLAMYCRTYSEYEKLFLGKEGVNAIVQGNETARGLLTKIGTTGQDKTLKNFDKISKTNTLLPVKRGRIFFICNYFL